MTVIDMTGQQFGRLTVIERAGSTLRGLAFWRCACECGALVVSAGASLRSGNTRSCGCLSRESASRRASRRNHETNPLRALNLSGEVFGRLTALRRLPNGKWLCFCACGRQHKARTDSLRSGLVKSCGCLVRDVMIKRNRERTVEIPSYSGAHDRVKRTRGSASLQRCVDCGDGAAHWSYDHTDLAGLTDERGYAYSGDPRYYAPRCVPCHKRYDKSQTNTQKETKQ